MANAEQILSLIRNHLNNDDAQFRKVALQISALEAKNGHLVIARAIQDLLKQKPLHFSAMSLTIRNKDAEDLLIQLDANYELKDMVIHKDVRDKLERVIKEYARRDDLTKHGLANRRKFLLYGAPGTGKTMTAGVLAGELSLPFFIVRTEKVVTKFLGETGHKLAHVFDYMNEVPGVYLFDEFDAIGSQRGMDNEVGEQRRILNTFLQLLDSDESNSFIIAATNRVEAIDNALFRRFDDVIEYGYPDREQRLLLLKEYLYTATDLDFSLAEGLFEGMSHAEIKMVCSDIFKESLINDGVEINLSLVKSILKMRHQFNFHVG